MKDPDGGLRASPQKLATIFVKIRYFVTVLRMTERYLRSLPTNSIKMEEKINLEAEVW